MKPWLSTFLKIAAAGPASLSGAQPAAPTGITPQLNPVQQIQQQRLAAQAEPSSPAGNPEIMQAQQEAQAATQQAEQARAQAESDAQAQVAQAQQQAQAQKMQADAQAAQDKIKNQNELQAARAEIEAAKAEAQLAKIESEKSIALSEIDAANKQHESKVQSDAQSIKAQADQAAAQQQTQQAATDPTGAVAVMSHQLKGITPAQKMKAASAMQSLQYGLPKKSPAGGGIMQPAAYRPDFGNVGNQILGAALPMVYGQADWSALFGRPQQAAQSMGFDPGNLVQAYGPMAQSFGADLARNIR